MDIVMAQKMMLSVELILLLKSPQQIKVVSALDSIKGVGEKTRTTLLQHFKSLKRIREASLADITAVIGSAKAQIVYEALQK